MTMPMVPCVRCSASFYAKPAVLKAGNGRYCSMTCFRGALRRGAEKACDTCGNSSYKQAKDIERSKSGKFFCSKRCQTLWRNQLYVGERHKNFTTGESTYRAVMKRKNVPTCCGLCATKDARVLAVHHIDKNRRNNRPENLSWLCHNCHFLVHHYEPERAAFMAAIV